MTCGILLVTHPGVGTALLDVATRLLRHLPLKTEAFEVPFDADMDVLLPLASAAEGQKDEFLDLATVDFAIDCRGDGPPSIARRDAAAGSVLQKARPSTA